MKLQVERDDNGKIVTKTQPEVFLPRCAYYTHFPSFFDKNSASYNTYHRSAHKKLANVKQDNFAFNGNQTEVKSGMNAKTGNYFNPFHFADYQNAIHPEAKGASKTPKAFWYDKLLAFQKNNAKSVVKAITKSDTLKINQDHDYPCVLFSLSQPGQLEKNEKIWTNFVSLYFIAIANKLAKERGLNIETIRRSSFDTIRPSIAECGKSLRISLGMSPRAYHECVVDTIKYLEKLFQNSDVFNIPADPQNKLNTVLVKYNKAKTKASQKICNVQVKNTLWETLWANGDSKNRSFATQIFRREHVVNVLIDDIMMSMGEHSLESIFASIDLKKSSFAQPMVRFLENFECVKDVITTKYANLKLLPFAWNQATRFNNPAFWTMIQDFGSAIGANQDEILELCQRKNFGELYHYLESWLVNFNFHPRKYQNVEDGYGSDSDTEKAFVIGDNYQNIHSKKFITATGMRAIQLSYACAKKFLEDAYETDPAYIETHAEKMYYETDEAIHNFPIPYAVKEASENKGVQKKLNFFDLNHCNAQQLDEPKRLVEVSKKERICILDVTSATTEEMLKNIIYIWKKAPKLRVIILVSSGLKNEQAMSDYNPYGCIRIFSRDKKDLKKVYNYLEEFEQKAQYVHPKTSHILRKNAKDAGFTPTNRAILSANI
jgi:hypothetical protein